MYLMLMFINVYFYSLKILRVQDFGADNVISTKNSTIIYGKSDQIVLWSGFRKIRDRRYAGPGDIVMYVGWNRKYLKAELIDHRDL